MKGLSAADNLQKRAGTESVMGPMNRLARVRETTKTAAYGVQERNQTNMRARETLVSLISIYVDVKI